ncbi:protein lsr2 precursor [Planobispora rosea]|uniref:Protein lsr2 n=1 Tax=Planobispora rosea TaxID=35762 RepID=A0A8J3S339_PLARO|nr:Lsr2 family protein [Planobispora rosea]GGS95231.1 protein lsr2 precursor [Planobispora rosea]GIH87551.1 protein lsr2 precursor [Planobispora rosea]
MAKKVVETFIDDLDGGKASGTISFAIEGAAYEIDLSDENADKLRKALAPFINAARPVRRERTERGRRGGGIASRAVEREKSARIREWAKSRGMTVSERGRIASSIVEQYEAAH